eukprot:s1700_g5.t1
MEPPKKKARVEEEAPEEPAVDNSCQQIWAPVIEQLKKDLPKSGVKIWTNPAHAVFRAVQERLPNLHVGAIKAGKGLDRYITPDPGWEQEFPLRHTVVQVRFTSNIADLGSEDWSKLTRAQQHRHAKPSHVMLCVFASLRRSAEESPEQPDAPMLDDAVADSEKRPRDAIRASHNSPTVPTWTPVAVSISGPKFQSLSEEDKSVIKRLHNNLGHPVADKLSRHLSEANFRQELVDGAKDYQCASCTERTKPSLSTPGTLKEPKEFNDRISIDGFEWTGQKGFTGYVLHILDEATRFHLGQRTQRDSPTTIHLIKQMWFQWAGFPRQIAHDQGGEFVTDEWKDLLRLHGISPVLSAAPWQRGRIERHGATIKEMLSRIDQELPIETQQQFDEAISQCFRAKNSLSIVAGYSPEQAVLRRASHLPASIVSDEDTSSHLACQSEDLASARFQDRLRVRTAARAAFVRADNSDALRRALLRQSRGTVHTWACGQLCMYWDKRKAPNMTEKGRWNGPAQVVCQESRTIVWVTHLNRLLRCARENLRPVSMREFQNHSSFVQTSSAEQLQRMSQQLQIKLRERSGLFQYLDLSEITQEDPNNPEENPEDLHSQDNSSLQPEEEPHRRTPTNLQLDSQQLSAAVNTPVPESPVSSNVEDAADGLNQDGTLSVTPSPTEPMESDQESAMTDPNMEPVYNVTILENSEGSDLTVEDLDTAWSSQDKMEHACVSFDFEMPRQQLTRFLKKPDECLPCLTAAAKKSRSEIKYSDLSLQEKELFQVAKQKELQCWLDTKTVQAIMRDRIHPSRIMSSRWILTWKEDLSNPSGRKAKARLVVKGFQDPDIDSVCSDSPTLTRDSRMLLLQTVASQRWVVQSFDITTAFLRGRSDERELAMEPPAELQKLLGMSSDQVCLLKGNAYGRVDAPLLFYKEFRKQLEKVGFCAHPLKPTKSENT